jgi:hypothetical protein
MAAKEFTPCKRKDFVKKLRRLGFSGPWPGGKHEYMKWGTYKQTIPHNREYSVPQLKELLKQAAKGLGRGPLTAEEWESLEQ